MALTIDMCRKGMRVHWRGCRYRITHVYLTDVRIESIDNPGVAQRVSPGQLSGAR